jgi:GLPGLI family protein
MKMKKGIIAFVFFAAGLIVSAQSIENLTKGKIIYEEVIQLNISVEGEAAAFAHMLPKEQRTEKVLFFNDKYSLYENAPKDILTEDMTTEGGEGIQIRMESPENKVFHDIVKRKLIDQREFMTRQFLINSEVKKSNWKFTGNQNEILGYICQEAVKMEDSTEIHAWYTSNIPVASGPSGHSDLPGMILAIDVDNGQRTIIATSIEENGFDEDKIMKPTKGKKVSHEEFMQIVDEKMKENGITPGSGPRVMVKVQQQ